MDVTDLRRRLFSGHVASQRAALRMLRLAPVVTREVLAVLMDAIETDATGDCAVELVRVIARGAVDTGEAIGRLQVVAGRAARPDVLAAVVRALGEVLSVAPHLRDVALHPFVVVARAGTAAWPLVLHIGVPVAVAAAGSTAPLDGFLRWAAWCVEAGGPPSALVGELFAALQQHASDARTVLRLLEAQPSLSAPHLALLAERTARLAGTAALNDAPLVAVHLLGLVRRLVDAGLPCATVARSLSALVGNERLADTAQAVLPLCAAPLLRCNDEFAVTALLQLLATLAPTAPAPVAAMLRLPLLHLLATARRGSRIGVKAAAVLTELARARKTTVTAAPLGVSGVLPPYVQDVLVASRLVHTHLAAWQSDQQMLERLEHLQRVARVHLFPHDGAEQADGSVDDVALVAAAAFAHDAPAVRGAALDVLQLLGDRCARLRGPFILLLLHALRNESSPDLVVHIIEALPELATDPIEALALSRVVDLFVQDERLQAVGVQLLFQLWVRNRRLWPRLHQVLLDASANPYEDTRVAVATIVASIAAAHSSSSNADELTKLCQRLLAPSGSPAVRALAIEAIRLLCQAGQANPFTVYDVLVRPAESSTEPPPVQIALCRFYAELLHVPLDSKPALPRPAQGGATAIPLAPDPRAPTVNHVLARLRGMLHAATSSAQVVTAALKALRHAPLAEIVQQESVDTAGEIETVSALEVIGVLRERCAVGKAVEEGAVAFISAAAADDLHVMPRRLLAVGSTSSDMDATEGAMRALSTDQLAAAARVVDGAVTSSKRPMLLSGLLLAQLRLAAVRGEGLTAALVDRCATVGLPLDASPLVVLEAIEAAADAAGTSLRNGTMQAPADVQKLLARAKKAANPRAGSTLALLATGTVVAAQRVAVAQAAEGANAVVDWLLRRGGLDMTDDSDEHDQCDLLLLAVASAALDPNDLDRARRVLATLRRTDVDVVALAAAHALHAAQAHRKAWSSPNALAELRATLEPHRLRSITALAAYRLAASPGAAALYAGLVQAATDDEAARGLLLRVQSDTDDSQTRAVCATVAGSLAALKHTALDLVNAALAHLEAAHDEALWTLLRALLAETGATRPTWSAVCSRALDLALRTVASPAADARDARSASVLLSYLLRQTSATDAASSAALLSAARLPSVSVVRAVYEQLDAAGPWARVIVRALAATRADRFPSLDWHPRLARCLQADDVALRVAVVELCLQYMHDVPDLLRLVLELAAVERLAAEPVPVRDAVLASLWRVVVVAPPSRAGELACTWAEWLTGADVVEGVHATFASTLGEMLLHASSATTAAEQALGRLTRFAARMIATAEDTDVVTEDDPLLRLVASVAQAARGLDTPVSLLRAARDEHPVGAAALACALTEIGLLPLAACVQALDGACRTGRAAGRLRWLLARACSALQTAVPSPRWPRARVLVAFLNWLLTIDGSTASTDARVAFVDAACAPMAALAAHALNADDQRASTAASAVLLALGPDDDPAQQIWRRVSRLLAERSPSAALNAEACDVAWRMVDAARGPAGAQNDVAAVWQLLAHAVRPV